MLPDIEALTMSDQTSTSISAVARTPSMSLSTRQP